MLTGTANSMLSDLIFNVLLKIQRLGHCRSFRSNVRFAAAIDRKRRAVARRNEPYVRWYTAKPFARIRA